jgi:hypothetical protein
MCNTDSRVMADLQCSWIEQYLELNDFIHKNYSVFMNCQFNPDID